VNKRSAPRFPVTLDVAVTFSDEVYRVCMVRDYCTGGMYLLCNAPAADVMPAGLGDILHIEFSNPLVAQRTQHRLIGRVARVAEHGFGVAFTERYPEAIAALSQLAESQAAAGRDASAGRAHRRNYDHGVVTAAINECQVHAELYLGQLLQAFYPKANDSLFDKAEEAKSNAQQAAYFGAMNSLRSMQVEISQNFLARFSEQFQIMKTSSMEERLEALETRFEELSVNPITLESNPVGPFVIASVFREALSPLVLEEEARATLYSVMEAQLQERLKTLYDELNAMLIARGILPDFSKKLEVLRQGGGGAFPVGEEREELELPELEDISAVMAGGSPRYGAAQPAAPSQSSAEQRPAVTGSARQPVAVPASPSGQGSPFTPATPPATQSGAPEPVTMNYARPAGGGAPQAAALANTDGAMNGGGTPVAPAYEGVQALMRLQQNGVLDDGSASASGYYSSGEVMQALGGLEHMMAGLDDENRAELDHVQYLSQHLDEVGGEDGRNISVDDRGKVAFVGGLFSSILQDQLLSPHARPWFSSLEVPLLKAGLLDNSLMEDEAHPARQLLNRLESLGDLMHGDGSPAVQAARERIEEILGGIRANVEHDPNVFAEAIDELDKVEEEVKGGYEENVAKLVDELERETALNRARQAILEALNHRLGHREVPELVLDLLDMGWKNLLLRTYLKNGADSSAYKTYLNVIDQLYARLMDTLPHAQDAAMPDETLLEWLERMLSVVSGDEEKREELLATVRESLGGEAAGQMDTRYVPALVSKMLHREQHTEASKPPGVEEDIWQLMLLDAAELQDEESFFYRDEDKGEQQVTMIWHEEQDPRYVFADNAGHKRLDLNPAEIANLLYHKVLTRLDEKSLSVTERATYHFLQSLHAKLAHQAQHDELTGLLNRKAFEKELEEAFLSAKSGQATHVLGYIDLDRFNVINTTCGHAEGDILLGKVAQVLRDTLSTDAVMARLGGDEFGILLKDCSRTDGLKRITEVHDAIRGILFVCESNEFKVTASAGMAEINDTSDSSGRLLSAVDAATFTAKDMGRDNIQIYNTENERISSRRNILDWVGRINVLFEKNLIQLRCQKIKPLQATVNSLPYYEVLLDVMDEEGNKVPLDEFIVAAERYNRITDIDTWVVDYVSNWLEEHRAKLDRISAVSINLSGSSLGNRKFMEHIERRLRTPGFPADKVCFEVTETVAIGNLDNASRFMRKLKETGCQFSLDDFGTGTSSYSYLKTLPIDYLKIDGAFVKDIATNGNDYAVVKSINEIGHAMGKKTVAEYVESEFAYEALKQIGLDYAQGFVVEKPIPLFKLFG
jgi:diguanylate cyclase (GGDEF)-like protein